MRRLSLVRQLGQAPANSTGQAGAGDGTGQLPGRPQLGQCQRALLQQVQAVAEMLFIGVGWGCSQVGEGLQRDHRAGVPTSTGEGSALQQRETH
jgi:hypothetical protein